MNQRISDSNVIELKSDEIFVFGSNLAGIHGAGAAQQALQWGAEFGCGFGRRGQTYAIPTKDEKIRTLPLDYIKAYVLLFIQYAKVKQNFKFLVTEIGCGLAGYSAEEIAPMFKDTIEIKNVYLPEKFWKILNDNQ